MNKLKICETFKSLSVKVEKLINKQLKSKDLSLTQGIVLVWLSETKLKELSVKEIEKKFGTAQSTTLGVINRLEQKELVTTYFTEQRKKNVKITDAGIDLVSIIESYINDFDELMFNGFTTGEKMIFIELLQRAENNISQYQAINNEED